jgi:hypothetical protein
MTVTVRWIPLVPAACGTRVARQARTARIERGGDGSQLEVSPEVVVSPGVEVAPDVLVAPEVVIAFEVVVVPPVVVMGPGMHSATQNTFFTSAPWSPRR